MVNILLGISISGAYAINGSAYDLHFTPTLITSTIGPLLLVVTMLVAGGKAHLQVGDGDLWVRECTWDVWGRSCWQ